MPTVMHILLKLLSLLNRKTVIIKRRVLENVFATGADAYKCNVLSSITFFLSKALRRTKAPSYLTVAALVKHEE